VAVPPYASPTDQPSGTDDLNITYLRPTLGERIRAEAAVLHKGPARGCRGSRKMGGSARPRDLLTATGDHRWMSLRPDGFPQACVDELREVPHITGSHRRVLLSASANLKGRCGQ
jgi:hypothetical protein